MKNYSMQKFLLPLAQEARFCRPALQDGQVSEEHGADLPDSNSFIHHMGTITDLAGLPRESNQPRQKYTRNKYCLGN